jgi:hypothetical protein
MPNYYIAPGADAEPTIFIQINGEDHTARTGVLFEADDDSALIEVLQGSRFADNLIRIPDGVDPEEFLASLSFSTETYSVSGEEVSYGDLFETAFGYDYYGGPFTVTPGVGIRSQTSGIGQDDDNLADTLAPDIVALFDEGFVVVIEAEVVKGSITGANPFANAILTVELNDSPGESETWQVVLDMVTSDGVTWDTTNIRLSDYDALFDETAFVMPGDGVIKMAARLSPTELAVSINGAAPVTGTPSQDNAAANNIGFRLINTSTDIQLTMDLKVIAMASLDTYATGDLAELSA